MKVYYKNVPGTYYTAFYSIENGKLFAALGDEEHYSPICPIIKHTNKLYDFIAVVKTQEFVDEILNSMVVHSDDSNQKFSIMLREKESCVSSNGEIIFAVADSMPALHYATKQIYENLELFNKPYFTGYRDELKMNPKCNVII